MPELPEVETVVRSVRPHLMGKRILTAEFTSPHVTPGDRDALAQQIIGRKILEVTRRGKFIQVKLDDGYLTMHLGMTGKLLIKGRPENHIYGDFQLSKGELLFHDPRQFGSIEWSKDVHPRVARLGPEPLEVPLEEFQQRIKRKAQIKALLLNQTFLAGVGNIYADESLFAAGIHPLASAASLSKARVEKLYHAIRAILAHSIELGGSSISDYVDAEGQKGWFQVEHRVYGREGADCYQCHGSIQKILVAQRGSHFCPRCQRR